MKQTVVFPPSSAPGGTSVKEAVTEAMSALKSGAYHDVAKGATAGAEELVLGNDPRLEDARSASDVFRWAKARTKPSYTAEEVGAANAVHDHPVATYAAPGFMSSQDKAKLDGIETGAQVNTVTSVAGKTGAVTLNKTDVELSNVDNTSDSNKPVSAPQQSALNLKLDADANAVSASKLSTPRTISLSGDASGSTSFDGSADTTIVVQVADDSHNHVISNVDGLQTALDSKVDKVTGKQLSDENYTLVEKNKLAGVADEATKNATDTQLRDRTTHTGVQPISTVSGLQSELDSKANTTYVNTQLASKVDKVAGKALSSNDFTDQLRDKLAALESSHFRGTFPSKGDLEIAILVAEAGDYADVDTAGQDAERYIWDSADSKWVLSTTKPAPLTAAQIKQMYESNPDTNPFDDAAEAKLEGIADGATKNATNAQLRDRATHTGTQAVSTVSGLQTSLDGKLDVSEYTASDVLEKVKTVDGTGSGLDADLLDGKHVTDLVPRNSNTPIGSNTLNYVAGTTDSNNGGFRVGLGGFQAVRLNDSDVGSQWGVAMHMNAFYRPVDGVYGYTAPNQYIPLVSLEVRNGGVLLKTHPQTGGSGNAHVPQGEMTVKSLWDSSDFSLADVNSWNAAYGWGNHADAGYLTSVSYGTTAGTAAQGNDARLSDSREWTASTVTQAEAEAGTATTAGKWTAQRVRQAIVAWWNGSAYKTKLDGIATGATKNSTDAQLRDRATHTGTQAISTVAGLTDSLSSKADQTSLDAVASAKVDKVSGKGLSTNDYTTTEKNKLNGIQAGAQVNSITTVNGKTGAVTLTYTDVNAAPTSHTHPLSQITGAGNLASLSTNDSTTSFLRGDGTWATPPNTDTTYTEIPTSEIDAGTSSTSRAITGRRMKYALDKKSDAGHGHAIGDITGLQTALDSKANTSTQVIAGTGLSGGGTLAANRTLSVNYGTAAGTAAQGNDSRLSNSREWTAETISQAEAEAGTATTRRAFTAERVRQAIVAWFNGISGTLGRTILTRTTAAQVRSDIGLGTAATKNVVQNTGNSVDSIMSQKAVTDAINATLARQYPAFQHYFYDNDRLIVQVDTPEGSTYITYNPDQTVNTITYPSGRVETYSYDSEGRLVSMLGTSP